MFDYLIIGAGAAGIHAALQLRQQWPNSTIGLCEKSRGVGGRLATRRVSTEHSTISVEMGAVSLNSPFRSDLLQGLKVCRDKKRQLVQWNGLWVVPGLGTDFLKAHLKAASVDDFMTQTRVVGMKRHGDIWIVEVERETTDHDQSIQSVSARNLVFAIPAPQCLQILQSSGVLNRLTQTIALAQMQCRWVWIVAAPAFDMNNTFWPLTGHESIDSMCCVTQKPGVVSPGIHGFQVMMGLEWSNAHADDSISQMEARRSTILAAMEKFILGFDAKTVINVQAHKWLYGHATMPLSSTCHPLSFDGLHCIGDWTVGYGVDDAFYSAELFVKGVERETG